jgi:hypothetical protein
MKNIDAIILKAKNSSGEQGLCLTKDKNEYWFTLCGVYNNEQIQIDFDSLPRSEIENLKTAIELILE